MGDKDKGIPFLYRKKKYARKVLQLAGSHYINLPAEWCKRNFVRAGDIVHIDVDCGDELHENLTITRVFPGSE